MVAIPGGEPLIHRDIGEIVKEIVARKKFVSLCTNALLLEKKLDLFEPSPYLFFSVHLDGLKEHRGCPGALLVHSTGFGEHSAWAYPRECANKKETLVGILIYWDFGSAK
jgi:hypothetical protein